MKEIKPKVQNRVIGEPQVLPKEGEFNEKWWMDVREFLERLRKQLNQAEKRVASNESSLKNIYPFSQSDKKILDDLQSFQLVTGEEIRELQAAQSSLSSVTNAITEKIQYIETFTPEQMLELLNRNANTNVLTDALYWKLRRIEELTKERIKELYESNPDTNAFTDALKDKLENLKGETYLYVEFPTPIGTWVIQHDFGYRPAIDVFDSAGNWMIARIQHTDVNTSLVIHSSNTSGAAILT